MIVRPYEQYDEQRMCFQTAQSYMGDYIDNLNIDLEPLADRGLVWSGDHEENVYAIGGLLPLWEGRAQAWMLMSPEAGKYMTTIHKAVKKSLIRSPFRRVEATVDIGFKPGVRWMKMLGFELEGYMRAYRPDGADMLLYARVRR